MNFKFKRHKKVRILMPPNQEYVEYYVDPPIAIEKGMEGKINLILPNGQYHVEIIDKKGNIIAYAPFNEEELETEE